MVGAIGSATDIPTTITMNGVVNNGTVSGSSNVGGIVGENEDTITMSEVSNDGNVSGVKNVGGLLGLNFVDNGSSASVEIYQSNNYGSVSGSGSFVAGIVGENHAGSITMTGVSNFGNVTGNGNVSGIMGTNEGNLTMSAIFNYGEVTGSDIVAGVLALNTSKASIILANNYGPIYATSNAAGGLIGRNDHIIEIRSSMNYGSITATNFNAGGLVSSTLNSSKVTNIYDSGNVAAISGNDRVGGLIGYNQTTNSTTIINSFNTGSVTALVTSADYGSIIGLNSNITLSSVFYLNGTAPIAVSGGTVLSNTAYTASGISLASMVSIETFKNTGWYISTDNTTTWSIGYQGDFTYPWLSTAISPSSLQIPDQVDVYAELNIIPLASLEDIMAIDSTASHTFASGTALEVSTNGGPDNHYVVITDIDLSTNTPLNNSLIDDIFTGTFDGNGYTLSGLAINVNASSEKIGMFKEIDGATIKNLTLSSFNITGGNNLGTLIGYISSGNNYITNIQIFNSHVHGADDVGGVIGENRGNLTITSITNYATVTSKDNNIGGIFGSIRNGNTVVNNTLNYATIDGNQNVGGIVGTASGGDTTLLLISTSLNLGPISGSAMHIGGIVGYVGNNTTVNIEKSANLVSIFGLDEIGGINGRNQGKIDLTHVYNIGNITASATSPVYGSIVGTISKNVDNNPYVTFTGIFYLTGTALQDLGEGSSYISGNSTPVSIAQMAALSTFEEAGWDIARYPTTSSVWSIQYDGQTTYPWLSSQEVPNENQIVSVIPVLSGQDLKTMEDSLFGSFEIQNDIDLATYTNLTQSFVNATFTGNLSGQGFTISGLAIDAPNNSGFVGLFSSLSGSRIENLILNGFVITGSGGASGNRFGILASEVNGPNTRVKNIIVTNSTIDATTGDEAGALIGIVQFGTLELENITISAIVKGNDYIGGLIGFVDGNNSEVVTGSNITILNSNDNGNKGHIFGTIRNSGDPLSAVHLTNINVINGANLKLVDKAYDGSSTFLATPNTAGTDFTNASIIAPYLVP